MKTVRFVSLLMGGAALALVLSSACSSSSHPKPTPGPKFTFKIAPGESLANNEFQVDLLFVNSSTLEAVEKANPDKWFDEDNAAATLPYRVKRYNINSTNRAPETVTVTDQTRFPRNLFFVVIANSPYEATPGQKDQRIKLIPLDGTIWPPKVKEVKVTLNRGGISVDPGWNP